MFVLSAADTNDIATPPELGTELTGLFPGAQFSLIEKRRPLSVHRTAGTNDRNMMRFFQEVQIG
jgi:hypothetical protein